MKNLGKIGMILGSLCLLFGLYVMLVVVPASEAARAVMDQIWQSNQLTGDQTYFDIPGYKEAFEASEKGVDFAGYVFFGSMLPLLMCIIASIKKDKMGIFGAVISLGAFLIGAIYGTHMFS